MRQPESLDTTPALSIDEILNHERAKDGSMKFEQGIGPCRKTNLLRGGLALTP